MELPPLAYEAHVRPGAPRVVRDVLDACANLLLEKEKISQQEFEALFEQ